MLGGLGVATLGFLRGMCISCFVLALTKFTSVGSWCAPTNPSAALDQSCVGDR